MSGYLELLDLGSKSLAGTADAGTANSANQNASLVKVRPSQLVSQRLIKGSGFVSLKIAEEPRGAMAVVVPARIVHDGIQTDPVNWDACLACGNDFMTDDAKPSTAQVTLDAGFGNKQRALVALISVAQKAGEGAVLRVIDPNRQVSVNPLIVKVVVHPDEVDVVRAASQLGTTSP
jgi:hypothetical protein